MKKLFLFTTLSALAFSFNACSGDDNSSSDNNNNGNGNTTEIGGTVTVNINGADKVFNTVVVDQDLYSNNDNFITVTASTNNSTSEIITFSLYESDLGANQAQFGYKSDNTDYYSASINDETYDITSIVEINSNNRLKGTFSGRLITQDNGLGQFETATFTNGKFDVTYAD